jgi:hypothetical protein
VPHLPAPVLAFIRYSYLWHSEHLADREEGQKDRHCAIIAALRPAEDPRNPRAAASDAQTANQRRACRRYSRARVKELSVSMPNAPGWCFPNGMNLSGSAACG